MTNTVAIILARGGSKGIPRKNLRKLGGISLVARSIRAARSSNAVDAVYVSTDDVAIRDEAIRFGALVIDRPEALSDDGASSESGWLHAVHEIRKERPSLDRLVMLQCTSPFTTGADIDGCLASMEREQASCALSVVKDHSFLWRLDAEGRGRGVNHEEQAPRKRRQDLAPAFRENGAVYCVKVEDFLRVKRRFCGPVALHVVAQPPVEIDDFSDFALCQAIMASQASSPSIERAKFRGVKALVMDFDGVHTDDRVIVDQSGVESVRVSRRDGLGIEMIRKAGTLHLLIISKEANPVVARRAEKLKVECLQSQDDKVAALEKWMAGAHLNWEDILYIGNDVNDLGPLERAGLSACPQDAHARVLSVVDWVIPAAGGQGAVRVVADELLAATAL
ncbi:acylneuraminate cytidylyltransferase [Nitratireductor aquimarinus]|uniref:acylneuraminate cytidylyltransferase n=1 Tax=Nitratireductor aquimarinus TaxID=889300 RepID=UPI0029367968|nr:acylneuraminate cytidylyltransferase [Nitratireductor aquimarinus]MDV2968145.1 acylneuraminate cytidylyltransferase [Nitratireductor aquimarinus]